MELLTNQSPLSSDKTKKQEAASCPYTPMKKTGVKQEVTASLAVAKKTSIDVASRLKKTKEQH